MITALQATRFLNSNWLETKEPIDEMTYFEYGYGPVMGSVLDRLDTSRAWQKDIDSGKSFEEAIRARFNP
ncbi:MAG: hypothetical protein H7301_00295 [Cryobacterium sp.]|nr:hypothetical protein [Oligoflexia bacterium]